jgi:acylphosphatase
MKGADAVDPCAEFVVEGEVQGVGFRFFTHRVAARLGVRGYVRNEPDGSVFVVAQAPAGVLEEFELLLREGPRLSRVTSVTRRAREPGGWSSFDVRG